MNKNEKKKRFHEIKEELLRLRLASLMNAGRLINLGHGASLSKKKKYNSDALHRIELMKTTNEKIKLLVSEAQQLFKELTGSEIELLV